jgi:hypothetical protein
MSGALSQWRRRSQERHATEVEPISKWLSSAFKISRKGAKIAKREEPQHKSRFFAFALLASWREIFRLPTVRTRQTSSAKF